MQWRTLMDVSFLAASISSQPPGGTDHPQGPVLGGHLLLSVPADMASLGGPEAAEGPPLEHQGPARLPVVLQALARIVLAAPAAAPGSMTVDVAMDVLTLVTDLCVPLVADGCNACNGSHPSLAACCASLAQVTAAVVAAAPAALADAAVAEVAADALLQVLALVAPRQGDVRATHLDALPPVSFCPMVLSYAGFWVCIQA